MLEKLIVQELAKTGEVPKGFLHEENLTEAISIPDSCRDTLVIDFSLLFSSTPDGIDELAKLRLALSTWGCIQVINHGINKTLLEEVFKVGKQFFELPLEERMKYSSTEEKIQGYANNLGRASGKTNYWSDTLFLNIQPEANRKLEFWPVLPECFSKTLDEYSKKVTTLSEGIYKAMALSLNLKEDTFLESQGKERSIAAGFNYYPPCPRPDRVLGVKPHSDGSTMTILLPDAEVTTLQFQKDDIWYKIPAIPNALLMNIGDLGEAMTNGIFKSAMHRVVTNPNKERMSVAAFCMQGGDKDIGPVDELISDENPRRYKTLGSTEYRGLFFDVVLNKGLTRLDALKY